jgi:precorrin-6A/cobalt-precorrin-6A reductase
MPAKSVLIIGGTGEARDIAALLKQAGLDPITSLAGITSDPVLPPGRLRKGGFGSPSAMAQYISETGIAAVVDASHPYATRITAKTVAAAAEAGVPCWRLERPAWEQRPGEKWISAPDVAQAAALLPAGCRALVTTGRRHLEAFLLRRDLSGLIRVIEAPDVEFPENWQLLLARPPFSPASERALFEREKITVLVTKNSGGEATRGKLDVARELGIAVVMVDRPAVAGVPSAWPPSLLVREIVAAISA